MIEAFHLWAKSDPYHPLWCHLLDTAAVCRALLPHFGGLEELPDAWICFLVGLHDVGKADPCFQNLDDALADELRRRGIPLTEQREKFRHERRSAQWIITWLRSELGWRPPASSLVSSAIRGHHGDFTSIDVPCHIDEATWCGYREALARMLREVLGVPPLTLHAFRHAGVAGVRLSGLVVLSDWIASNPDLFHYPTLDRTRSPAEYHRAACAEAERAVASLRFAGRPAPASEEPPRFLEVFPKLNPPRRVQALLEELTSSRSLPPGLVLIEDQMGEGKSEAALYLIECWSRILGRHGAYLALPTAATSNQMHARYREFLGGEAKDAPRLVHGMAWLVDDRSPQGSPRTFGADPAEEWVARDWFANARRALLAPEAVGTIDQALMSVLHVRFGFLRFLGLSTKSLLIDEVHAYDEYMTVLLEQLLRWCRAIRIPVVLLSATLSERQKGRLLEAFGASLPAERHDGYPLITAAPFDGPAAAYTVARPPRSRCAPARRISIRVGQHPGVLENPARIAALAVEQARRGGCVCVLVNTVTTAQQVFQELSAPGAVPEGTELFLFHARFRARERARREKEVVARFGKFAGTDGNAPRPERAILVATQVVEQSLDVDFDVLLTEVAPIDLLLQRCGRLHRHLRAERYGHSEPAVHILLPEDGVWSFGRTGRVYDTTEPLVRTCALLQEIRSFELPDDFRRLIRAVYDNGPLPEGAVPEDRLRSAAECRANLEQKARDLAQNHLLPAPDPRSFPLTSLAVEEDADGTESASYFRARTRLGDETCRVLLLNSQREKTLLASERPPHRRVLQWLLKQQVSLPAWWLRGTTPAEGFDALEDAPRWLRGYRVLLLRDRIWRGSREGRGVVLKECPRLGLRFMTEEREEDDTAV